MKRGISELTTTFVHSPVSKTCGQKQRTLDKKTSMRFCAQTESNSPSIYGSIKYSCYKLYRGMRHEFYVHHTFFYKLCCFSDNYEGWNFNSGNYLFTKDTK